MGPRDWKVTVIEMSRVCQNGRRAGEFGRRVESHGHGNSIRELEK